MIQGFIFVVVVLAFRRGIVGEIATALARRKPRAGAPAAHGQLHPAE